MEAEFWENRWKLDETGWDMGSVSTPLKEYIDQIRDKSVKILIPGCGNAYEAQYLWEQGFKNIIVMDISETALKSFSDRFKTFPKQQILHRNFFDYDDQFDLILEQTFFCAIEPKMRDEYVKKMYELLNADGKLVGLLFDFPLDGGPPFGGSKAEYLERFGEKFEILVLERCYNSIKPREGRELFFICRKGKG